MNLAAAECTTLSSCTAQLSNGITIEGIEDLQTALFAAIKVNKLLNSEVEKLAIQLEKADIERESWQQHVKILAKKLRSSNYELSGNAGDEDEYIRQILERCKQELERQRTTPTGPPSMGDSQILESMVTRGRACGWLVERSEVTIGEVLGEGSFGTTYKGLWRGARVAVKCVRISCDDEFQSFLREIEALSMIRHPNTVPFLGACLQAPDTFWLLTEFMPGGTLATWLHGEPNCIAKPNRTLLDRVEKALEVARGMQALESCNPPILHRDLKPTNVFIDSAGCARIGDFGLARRLLPGTRATLTGETGTYLYMSPEMVRHEIYDAKTDVWSWGVLFVECLSCELPYQNTFLTPIQIALGVSEEKLRPQVPSYLNTDLQGIAILSLDYDAELRPSFTFIATELGAVLERLRREENPSTMTRFQKNLSTAWRSVFG